MNRPSQWNDAVYTLIVKAMARVGWWLQRPLIKLQRESMTTVDAFNDADDQEIDAFIGEIRERKSYLGAGEEVRTSRLAPEDFDNPVSQPCAHEHVTVPKYSGGNYGYYGYVRCLDCGAWKDDYSDWHTAHDVFDQHVRTLDTSTETIKSWPTVDDLRAQTRRDDHAADVRRGLEQPHMGDELTPAEINEYLEHGTLPNEAERLRELRRRENMRELATYSPAEIQAMSLEQYRALFGGLEQASTMPPEAPQEPVSAAEPEDEWKCLHCGKHVDRASEWCRYKRTFSNTDGRYVTIEAWCDASCYTLWQHDVANDAR